MKSNEIENQNKKFEFYGGKRDPPPLPLPWNIFFSSSNKVRVICNILKSNKIVCDSRHFEDKSNRGMSEVRGSVITCEHLY